MFTEPHISKKTPLRKAPQQSTCPVTGMKFIQVPGGIFQMGNVFATESPIDDYYLGNPVHSVEVDEFYMAKYPVMQAEWVKIMGNNPSQDVLADNYPVTGVSWFKAHDFITCLNSQTGQAFRLPSEAEWEYAARSGGKMERWAGTSNEEELDEYVWHSRPYEGTHPIGMLKPNGLGLYDMSGNVWEWCEDRNLPYYAKNPLGPGRGVQRVLRGCCSINEPMEMQLADRFNADPDETCFGPGFRLALSVAEVGKTCHSFNAPHSTLPSHITCPATGMEFVLVKGGEFLMGDLFAEGDGRELYGESYCSADELPLHEVELADFSIGMYPVTQGEWIKIMGQNPSRFNRRARYPVTDVSWYDTQEFIKRLNSQTGRTYRLLTEAEWEYAARSGGRKERWAGTSDEEQLGEYAWHHGNLRDGMHPVGMLKPNGLGLYDMCGNVLEWCQDIFDSDYYAESPRCNPQGPSCSRIKHETRVVRGGYYYFPPSRMRVASRFSEFPGIKSFKNGFRLVLSSH